MTESTEPKGFLDNLGPRHAFYVGLVGGVLLIGTIGFVIVSGLLLRKGVNPATTGAQENPAAKVENPGNQGEQPAAVGEIKPVSDSEHIRGAKNAPVTLIIYSDLECPFCSRFHETVQQAEKEYSSKLRIVFRHFPLDSLHPNARPFAEASECIAKLGGNGAFWKFVDAVFGNGGAGSYKISDLPKLASDAGVKKSDFEACQKTAEPKKAVEDQYQTGITAGVRGTPGSFVNGVEVPGAVPYEQLKQMIDAALKK